MQNVPLIIAGILWLAAMLLIWKEIFQAGRLGLTRKAIRYFTLLMVIFAITITYCLRQAELNGLHPNWQALPVILILLYLFGTISIWSAINVRKTIKEQRNHHLYN